MSLSEGHQRAAHRINGWDGGVHSGDSTGATYRAETVGNLLRSIPELLFLGRRNDQPHFSEERVTPFVCSFLSPRYKQIDGLDHAWVT